MVTSKWILVVGAATSAAIVALAIITRTCVSDHANIPTLARISDSAIAMVGPQPLVRKSMASIDFVLPRQGGDTHATKAQVVWSQASPTTSPTEESIDRIIASGKAEALEGYLAREEEESLKCELQVLNDDLVQIGTTYLDEIKLAKAQLATIPSRIIVFSKKEKGRLVPREQQPNYQDLLTARRELESNGKGAVWGDYDSSGNEIHFLIVWSEWPAIRQLIECQAFCVKARTHIVRNWIATRYYAIGPNMFHQQER